MADFDGDGIADEARLMVGADAAQCGLVAKSSVLGKAVVLEVGSCVGFFDTMGVAVALPGTYLTACGKGYFECDDSEPAELTLARPAIDFFKVESANSFYWWKEDRREFVRTWMSD